jgi:hypothetical protein
MIKGEWKSVTKLRRAKNGCSENVSFRGKAVYYPWDSGSDDMTCLGRRQEKNLWTFEHLKDVEHADDVHSIMKDWTLFQNGWLVAGDENRDLFSYLCQIGNYGFHRPKALGYLKPHER